MKNKNNKLPIIKLNEIELLRKNKYEQEHSMLVGFFNIPVCDWTDDHHAGIMGCSDNYYERLDFEFVTWDSVVHCVDPKRTLEELLKIIWDKYDLIILSWIIRKSVIQIQSKLQELGIEKYLKDKEKLIVKKLSGNFKIDTSGKKVIVTIHQTENREIEKWLIENNSFRQFDFEKVKIPLFNVPETIKIYLENNDIENVFKLMICFCNLFMIPFRVNIAEESLVDFDAHFVLNLNEIYNFSNYLMGNKLLNKKEHKLFQNEIKGLFG